VVSLGIDTYGRDPIGDFALTTSAYHEIGRRAGSTGRRLVILQEGGYFIDDLGENVRQWLAGARVGLGLDPGDEAASGTGDGAPSGAEGGAVLEERTS
jgi:acetoin utilization deacetylase AcuC-like enzyme